MSVLYVSALLSSYKPLKFEIFSYMAIYLYGVYSTTISRCLPVFLLSQHKMITY